MNPGSNDDAFIAKYDSMGKTIWSKRFGDAGNQDMNQDMNAVAVDGMGNIVVFGAFQGSMDLGGGPLTAAGTSYTLFVAKFDGTGKHLWSKTFGTAALVDVGARSMALDSTGNVFIAGNFSGTLDLGGTALTVTNYGAYLAKLDASGSPLWGKAFGDGDDEVSKVVVDSSGNAVITGNARDAVDFGGGPLLPVGNSDPFVAKFDGTGAHKWSKLFGGIDGDYANSAAVDAAGKVFTTGRFSGAVDFGGGSLGMAGTYDQMYLLELNGSGNHVRSKTYPSTNHVEAFDLVVDASGNLVITGQLNGTVDFGGGPLATATGSVFAAKFDGSGMNLWGKAYKGGNALAVASDGAANAYLLGDFYGTMDFGGGAINSGAGGDFFLAKLQP